MTTPAPAATTAPLPDLPIGPFTRIVSVASAFAEAPTTSTKPESGHKNHTGAIVGGVIGGVAGLVLLLAAGWLALRWRRQRLTRRKRKGHQELGDADTGSTTAPTPRQKSEDGREVAQVQSAVIGTAAGTATGLPGLTAAQTQTQSTTGTFSADHNHASSLTVPSPAARSDSPLALALGQGHPGHGVPGGRGHARSPSLASVLSDYVDASEIAATPISASYIGERRMMEARGEAFYSSAKSIRSQQSLRAPSPCRSARYKSLDGAVLDDADLKLLRPVERGESSLFTH